MAVSHASAAESATEPELDLRALVGALDAPILGAVPKPVEWRRRIRRLAWPEQGVVGTTNPLFISGVVDGIQGRLLLCRRSGRPVFLEYAAAAHFCPATRAVGGLVQRAYLAGSALDEEWMSSLPGGALVDVLSAVSSQAIELEARRRLEETRIRLEAAAVRAALDGSDGFVLVDGSIRTLPSDERLVGVVKSVSTQYLGDESHLESLCPGEISESFQILPDWQGEQVVYSCYLRLHRVPAEHWTAGLVRLESLDPKVLAALAAFCVSDRQHAASDDPRWPQHLTSVRKAELALKMRRPYLMQ